MKFASWTYNANEVQLIDGGGVDFHSVYSKSQSWELEDVITTISQEFDENVEQNFSTVTYTFKLKRRPKYYVINLLAPFILVSVFSTWVSIAESISCALCIMC